MRLRTLDLEIDPSNPFAHDKLERAIFAEALYSLVTSTPSPVVLNIDAPWGSGKSTFLRMWIQLAEAKGVKTLLFDAWETDLIDDPLAALIGELGTRINEMQGDRAAQVARLKRIGGKLLRRSIPAALKLATLGVVDLTDLTEETLGDLTSQLAEAEIHEYEESKKSLHAFREQLRALASSIHPEVEGAPSLVLIVDELDRCRPDHAIRILEVIKHFFSVPGLCFVLATDGHQLRSSIRHAYGSEMDPDGYLRRFFDLSLRLPEPEVSAFVDSQFARFGLDEFFSKRTHPELRHDREQVAKTFVGLFQALECSLRDQERCFSLLVTAVRATPDNRYIYPHLLCALIVLRLKSPALYRDYVSGKVTAKEVMAALGETAAGARYVQSRYSAVVEAYLAGAQHRRGDAAATDYQAISNDEKQPSEERDRASLIVRILSEFSFRRSPPSLSYMRERLELVAPANTELENW